MSKTEHLFRSRLSSQELRLLLDSASKTHTSYKERSDDWLRHDAELNVKDDKDEQIKPLAKKEESAIISTSINDTGPRIAPKLQERIIDKVSLNRLTIIIGPTGSGKSTLIPPLLIRGLGGPILCTQPRRLAVVAIAKRVASECGVELGGQDVGFQVGNYKQSTQNTKLLFTTAGTLLEELLSNGGRVLSRFRVLVIDECHERSPESDLVLGVVKQFMKKYPEAPTRIVLMSATFPHERYGKYFSDVPGCQSIDAISLETFDSFTAWHEMVDTLYLEQTVSQLPDAAEYKSYVRTMRLNPDSELETKDKSLSADTLRLIRSLITWLDHSEPPNSVLLIFAPTFRQLEQINHAIVAVNGSSLLINVLHSSVDTEECLRTINMSNESPGNKQQRRVFLASAIADSSVTIPGVSCVVDLCRSLELQWDSSERTYLAKIIWSSKSICDQRRGRTGRTCPGRVFRLIHYGFFISRCPPWPNSQLPLRSCHNEALALGRAFHDFADGDPWFFLEQCIDPPSKEVIEDAIKYLVEIGAFTKVNVEKNQILYSTSGKKLEGKIKVVATPYGELLSALPLGITDAKVVIAGARVGLLHEMLALRAMYNHKPSPIVHLFGDTDGNQATLESFYPRVKANDSTSTALAHLSAYMFWDTEWNRKRRKHALEQFRVRTAEDHTGEENVADIWMWTPELEEDHFNWCKTYDINPTSVRSVSEIVESAMNVMFLNRFEHEWLRCNSPTPIWKGPSDWKGSFSKPFARDMMSRVYGTDASNLCEALSALCNSQGEVTAAFKYAQLLLDVPDEGSYASRTFDLEGGPMACIHFLMGKCDYGKHCRHSHSSFARRPPCRFYFNGTCSKGSGCLYAHDDKVNTQPGHGCIDVMQPQSPIRPSLFVTGGHPAGWFMQHHKSLLMLGEGNFRFSDSLEYIGYPPFLSSTNISVVGPLLAPNRLQEVDATRLHMDERIRYNARNSGLGNFAWNFPLTGNDDDLAHEHLILETFQSMAQLLLYIAETHGKGHSLQFAMSLHSDQLSRWNVFRSAWRVGWRLQCWSHFDHMLFPGYQPTTHTGDTLSVDHARFYVFRLTHHDASGS
jgi:HrpA-like RNA helicase